MKRFAVLLSFAAIVFAASFLFAVSSPVRTAVAQEEPDEAADSNAAEKKSEDEKGSAEADDSKEKEAAEKSPADKEESAEARETAKKEDAKPDDGDTKKSDTKADEKADAKPEAKKRKTHTVEPKRLKIDITLDGAFVARTMAEVSLRPESWSSYEIEQVVEHGAKVRKGETLIEFDSEKLDEAIADLELEQRLNELAILRAEEELPRTEKTLKLDFEEAERASQQAKEDFERYKEVERPMAEKTAEFMVKFYNFMLDYEQDELDQLQKMYEADDLTEETEEIVLKRQRSNVEFAQFSLENAKVSRDLTLKVRLPRSDIRVREALERTSLARARAQTALSLDMNRARYEQEQRKQARAKSLDRHAKLLEDRGLMEIKSPADGIVYYGENVNGRWSDTQTLINKYKPHGNVTPGSVLMTIVETRPIYVTSTVEESKRPDVKDGQKAKIALPAEDSDRVGGEVKSVSSIPVSPGKFEINFEVEQDKVPEWIVPGMSCKVQITTYNKKDALVLPKAAVHDDEANEDQKYVWLIDPDDEEAKPTRRNVKLGKRKGEEVEILKGLKKGDVVSLEDESKKEEKKS